MSDQKRWLRRAIALAAAFVLLGCGFSSVGLQTIRPGALRTSESVVELGDAETVRVAITMGAGELKVDNGAQALMEGQFTYNVPEWKPTVSYDITGGNGRLIVRQPNTDRISVTSDARYQWDLRFADNVPLDLRIECGAGRQEIDLAGLDVTDLDVKLGAGQTEIALGDNRSLTRADIDIGAGDAAVLLDGTWHQDAVVDIRGGVGRLSLRLPRDVGVRIEVARGIGDIDAGGLSRRGGAWVNEAFGYSEPTLEVRVQAGLGRIELEVAE